MAWHWVTLLSCTAVQTRLPAAALQLLNDLVQLLFYHTEQAGASRDGHATGEKTQVGLDPFSGPFTDKDAIALEQGVVYSSL